LGLWFFGFFSFLFFSFLFFSFLFFSFLFFSFGFSFGFVVVKSEELKVKNIWAGALLLVLKIL